jgi:hypothetical protein
VFKLCHELLLFSWREESDWPKLFKDKDWVANLTYLIGIFPILDDLDTFLHG